MSDDEDYNSEEDIDYVPSGGELGSEEENSGDEEDLSVLADDAGTAGSSSLKKGRRKKQNKADLAPRKRKGGIKLEGEDVNGEEGKYKDDSNPELAQQIKEEGVAKKEEKEKKRADDLWSSFLSDVKPAARPPPKPAAPIVANEASESPSASSSSPSVPTSTAQPSSAPQPAAGKVTITKVFDFAGEEVKITKEVDVNSKEAKEELKKQEDQEEQKAAVSSAKPSILSSITRPSAISSASPSSSILGNKRPAPTGGGLGGLLSKIGKKQKMGTLEKSKMDWDSFKKKEGIEEDLKIHNKGKDGYIERMAFLNRADVRQFEVERDLRLNKSGKR